MARHGAELSDTRRQPARLGPRVRSAMTNGWPLIVSLARRVKRRPVQASRGEPVGELDQRRERLVRLAAVGRGLARAIDPRYGDTERAGRDDVVEIAPRGVDPVPAADEAPRG